MSNFFIGRNALVTRAICSGVPFVIISPIAVGQTCHDSPYVSLSHPHCSAYGLNLNKGPALMAITGWPFNAKETMSQSPVGVGTS